MNGVGGTLTSAWDDTEDNDTTLAAQIPNILAGRAYINFHTNQFTGGEYAVRSLCRSRPA